MKRASRSIPSSLLKGPDSDHASSELLVIREELCNVLNNALINYLGERGGASAAHTVALWRAHGGRFSESLRRRGWNPTQAEAMSHDNDRLADMLSYVVALQRPTTCTQDALWTALAHQHLERAPTQARSQIALL